MKPSPEQTIIPKATVKQFPEPEREKFPLVPFWQIELDRKQAYLVKGLIPADALVIAWGEPKCGKSFWAFDLAFHIAAGWDYRGRRVAHGDVVYCALEGAGGYGKRRAAIEHYYQLAPGAKILLHLMAASLDLIGDHSALIAAIRRQLSGSPVCVVIDTLNRSLRGSESSDEDVADYIRASDAIKTAFGCVVIIVHHCGYNDTRMRGHSSLIGALDAELSVKKGQDGYFTVKVERAKDDKEGETIACRLRTVDLGLDDEGDPLTSCVVEAAEADAQPRQAPSRKMTDKQTNALAALRSIVGSNGEAAPASFKLPAGVVTVRLAAWRDELYRRGNLDKSSANPTTDFQRLKEQLQARQFIAVRDDLVWLA
jgi:hypothetical protein